MKLEPYWLSLDTSSGHWKLWCDDSQVRVVTVYQKSNGDSLTEALSWLESTLRKPVYARKRAPGAGLLLWAFYTEE